MPRRLTPHSIGASPKHRQPAPDDPRYAEWKAALERLVVAPDRLHEAAASEREKAQAEHANALAAYQKICDEIGI